MRLRRLPGWGACLPLTLVLASCSGGGNALSTLAPTGAGPVASKAARVVPASFTFTIPRPSSHGTAHSRKPQYLPASALSVEVGLVTVNGSAPSPAPAPTIANVGSSVTGCTTTSGGYTCIVALGLPIGSDAVLVQAFDAASAAGNMLSTQQSTVTVVQGSANSFAMTLDATPGQIVATPPSGTACSGSPVTCNISGASAKSYTVTVADAHGTPLANNTIAGSPVLSVASSNTAIAMVTATQTPYRVTLTPVATGTASIAVTASPATGTSGLAPTTFIFTATVMLPSVTTLAGSTTPGSADGTGAAARFYGLQGVAVDASGNVYVADTYNQEIRKVTSAGVVTTFAGSTTIGNADGTGTAATFHQPTAVAMDTTGNLYVGEYGNNDIRKVTPAGVVTTLAGNLNTGNVDGTGGAARFHYPDGLAVDTAGNVYVADVANHEIRKVTPAGVVTTLAGNGSSGNADGTGAGARFYYPNAVAVDTAGNVYVADSSNNKIRKVTSAGVVTTFAGTGGPGSTDGAAGSAKFRDPEGIAVDTAGNIYVADSGNNEIRKITSAGIVSTLAGNTIPGSVDGTAASFHYPMGMAFDAAGNVYVADYGNNELRKIAP